jgi:hypothetical protein
MVGEITFLKHELHRDDVKTSDPHETEDSFCHSFPHLIHFTRNLSIPCTRRNATDGFFAKPSRWSEFHLTRYHHKVGAS